MNRGYWLLLGFGVTSVAGDIYKHYQLAIIVTDLGWCIALGIAMLASLRQPQ